MRKTYAIATLVLGLSVTGTAVLARDHGMEEMRARFVELDLNGDGAVSREEIELSREARFSEADTDGSGTLTEAEFVAAAAQKARDRAAAAFRKLDADGDGILSRDAVEAQDKRAQGLDRIFERVDANGDDRVTEAEFEAAIARFAEMRERRGFGLKRQ